MNKSIVMISSKRTAAVYACSMILLLLFFFLNIFIGAVNIPFTGVCEILTGSSDNESWRFIIIESRLTQAITALLCGAALSVAGLLLQTCFANPLADTSILGVNAGASLGVAITFLLFGGSAVSYGFSLSEFGLVLMAAFIGAIAVLSMLTAFAAVLRSNLMLLIVGIMVSYVTSAIISMLSAFATSEGVHSFVFWGMGNFGGVPYESLPAFSLVVVLGIVGALTMSKPLNAMLLGENYATNLGFSIKSVRLKILLITGVLGAAVTAFCGPVAFIGLAVPHVARFLAGTENHRILMPLTILCGSAISLACNFVCNLPVGSVFIPLNAVTSICGVPVILYVLLSERNRKILN